MRFAMTPRGPFDLAHQNRFFGGWPEHDGGVVLCFPVEGWAASAAVLVRQVGAEIAGEVQLSTGRDPVNEERAWQQALAALSLDADGSGWPEVGARDPVIGDLQRELDYLRPSLFHSPYEAAVNFVLNHRISMREGKRIRQRIADEHGDALTIGGAVFRAFVRPDVLSSLDRQKGVSEEKMRRLAAVADAARAGWLDRAALRAMTPKDALAKLKTLPGIGDFFASGILARGAGQLDVVMDDHVTREAVARAYGRTDVRAIAEAWRPYRTWATVLLHVWIRRSGLLRSARAR